MKNLKPLYVILILLGSFRISFAQQMVQKKGDYYFGMFSYAKAIPEYEKMIGNDFNTNHAHMRLAESYLLIRDFKKSLPHFDAVINNPEVPQDYYFKYAMALYSDGQLKNAEKWLKKYKKFNKNDSRVKRFLKDGNLASVVFNSRERYEVTSLNFNSKESDFGTYTKDGVLYFASSRKDKNAVDTYEWNGEPWLDMYSVEEGNSISVPQKMRGNINSKYHESSLIYTTDYKKDTVIYFTRNSYFMKKETFDEQRENNLKIYKAEFSDGEWTTTRSLPMNSDDYSTGHPFVSPDGKRLYYTSDRPGSIGGTDIYYSEIHERGRIGAPINAGPIVNTEGNEMFPFINKEGQLFFSSDGHIGFGQLDVFTTISNEKGKIMDIINLGNPINSKNDDFAYYALEDGINGYISSNREGGKGSDDIYKFQFTPSLAVEGIVTDAINLSPLDSVSIALFNQKNGEKVGQTITDENGRYEMFINRKQNYRIEAIRKTHPHKDVYLSTQTTPRIAKTIQKNIELKPVMDVRVLADLNKIYFDFNKSNIRPDAALELNKVIKLMTVTYPNMVIKLEAHTDPVGSYKYNDDLSERRAKSTYEYLIVNGVKKEHIMSYKGFGKRKLVNDCTGKNDCSPELLELNRRTEFPIVQIKKGVSTLAK